MPRSSILKNKEPGLSLSIAGVKFQNPVIAAAGTFGYGWEYEGLLEIASLGGICTKGLTLKPRTGNTGIRLHETPSGMMSSIGLENHGIEAFIENELPRLRKLGPVIIANLSCSTKEEYIQGARLLDASKIDMIELNLSCPNIKAGGLAFGADPVAAASLTRLVREDAPNKPLMVKLTPNAPDLITVAQSCVNAGADAISLVNTFKGLVIDVNKREPIFENIFAGLSGPAIRPIALRLVWELYEKVTVPIVGMGGIASTADALQFLMAGATAVQIGSATFARPPLMTEIITGIREYMTENGYTLLDQLSIRKAGKYIAFPEKLG
jgi:dihydroorotate dehydrogenase (NAD+) catalytic subunit